MQEKSTIFELVPIDKLSFFKNHKPYTRWWWFSGDITEKDIAFQIDWMRKNGFGGFEIAWVYPHKNSKPGCKLYDEKWCNLVSFAKKYADKNDMGCDFTYGSLWPFGGSFVKKEDAIKTYNGISDQRLFYTWENAYIEEGFYIVDHLKIEPLEKYAKVVGEGLKEAMKGSQSALFEDSWEVLTEDLWTEGFGEEFIKRNGYDILPYMPTINDNPNERYDYRMLIAEYVIEKHYKPYTRICNEQGGYSRVQCHGAPTDMLAAFSSVDVPESEALLFDADYSTITASAAALSGKQVVSTEAFTTIYGWVDRPGPAPYSKKELITDIKLLADALFANGVNQIIWHGMPFNPEEGGFEFYATVHVSHDGSIAKEILPFNNYMEKISEVMKIGVSYNEVAAYLPYEDTMMLGRLPKDLEKPSAFYHWEMQYTYLPEALKGYHPIWVSNYFFEDAYVKDEKLICGDCSFSLLYIDTKWVDIKALKNIYRFAKEGFKICIINDIKQPGKIKNEEYQLILNELHQLQNVSKNFTDIYKKKQIISGDIDFDFWCRVDENDYYIFIAHPNSKGLHYPMKYGQSIDNCIYDYEIDINIGELTLPYRLVFRPYQSILLKVSNKRIEKIDIEYLPIELP